MSLQVRRIVRETVAEILRTGFDEMRAMAHTTARQFNREDWSAIFVNGL